MRFAENMIAVAVGWQVFEIHKDPLDLGLIGLAEFVPLLVLALPAGHLADLLPRRMIAALALTLMVGVSIALLIVTVTDPGVVWPYFLLAALTGVAAAAGWVWAASRSGGTVSRVDPAENRVVDVITVGASPTDLAADENGVWVAVE